MPVASFDTYEFFKEMKSVGFEERQADVISVAMRNLQDARLDELATKPDIKELDTKLETSLKELELRMVSKLGGMIIIAIGLIFGLFRIWPLPVQYIPAPGQEYRLPPAVVPGR